MHERLIMLLKLIDCHEGNFGWFSFVILEVKELLILAVLINSENFIRYWLV